MKGASSREISTTTDNLHSTRPRQSRYTFWIATRVPAASAKWPRYLRPRRLGMRSSKRPASASAACRSIGGCFPKGKAHESAAHAHHHRRSGCRRRDCSRLLLLLACLYRGGAGPERATHPIRTRRGGGVTDPSGPLRRPPP